MKIDDSLIDLVTFLPTHKNALAYSCRQQVTKVDRANSFSKELLEII